jgi:23S rRNA pseudouridine1911/1915/1917 synthase
MAVLKSGGRSAITHYQIQQTFTPVNQQEKVNNHKRRGAASHTLAGGATISLASCRLETGRTHQVRVHMAHLGTPIIGDAIYGGGFQSKIRALPETVSRSIMLLKRQALHAAVLAFRHPRTRKIMAFKQAVPNDMADILKALASLDVHVSKN